MSRVADTSAENIASIERALGQPPGTAGSNGTLLVTTVPDGGNRGLVRQWLIAKGLPSAKARELSVYGLQFAYNRAEALAQLLRESGIIPEEPKMVATERVEAVNPDKPILAPAQPVRNGLTRSQEAEREVASLLKSRQAITWVTTREERRAESHLQRAGLACGYTTVHWDVAAGCTQTTATGAAQPVEYRDETGEPRATRDIDTVLSIIAEQAQREGSPSRTLWILRDVDTFLAAPGPLGAGPRRMLRNLANMLPGVPLARAQAIIILTTQSDIPPDLQGHVRSLDWPTPDRSELAAVLDTAIRGLPEDRRIAAADNGTREAAIDAAVGLSGEEAAACYARSLVSTGGRIDPIMVATEKKRVISREKILEWIDPVPGGRAAIGGLGALWDWLEERELAYSQAAVRFGLTPPRGILIVGIPGTGKSLTAKVVTSVYGIPGVRLDLAAAKGKFVGESEANLRRVLRTIESMGRCVVWLDELEKALAGATGGASADGGVSADALGTVLTWMQDRKGEAFVVATSNDISALPPELYRKGRFDEIWFVDVPASHERQQILSAALRTHKRSIDALSGVNRLIEATDGWTGAEIAALVPDAMFSAYKQARGERDITTEDLLNAANRTVPLSKTAPEKIARLRKWGAESARNASRGETVEPERPVTQAAPVSGGAVRQIDL